MLLSGPITAYQGEIKMGVLRLPDGPAARLISLTETAPYTATFKDLGCLGVDQCVHLWGQDQCCGTHFSTYRITAISPGDNSATLELVQGYEPRGEITNGQAVRALDLRGFSLEGVVASRNPNTGSMPGLVGSVARGSNQILITAPLSAVTLGDSLTMPAAGISAAKITGIYRASGGSIALASTSCGCGGVGIDGAEGGSNEPQQLVLAIDAVAIASVSTSTPKAVEITGRSLADFRFESIDEGCGVIGYSLNLGPMAEIALPGDACTTAPIRIGCYQIALIRGRIPPREYPARFQYYDWLRIIGAGDVVVKPILINLHKAYRNNAY